MHSSVGLSAVRFIALTGVRRGECENLKWDEVDAKGACIALGEAKTGPSLRPPAPWRLPSDALVVALASSARLRIWRACSNKWRLGSVSVIGRDRLSNWTPNSPSSCCSCRLNGWVMFNFAAARLNEPSAATVAMQMHSTQIDTRRIQAGPQDGARALLPFRRFLRLERDDFQSHLGLACRKGRPISSTPSA
jgi:hypothetical protein